jgi:Rrf2 family protein
MQLNNTSQYAVRILSYIAREQDNHLLNATKLSEVLNIPYKFLTKIMTKLVKGGFIVSIRGRDGGFQLKRSPEKISVDDILNLFNDSVKDEQCLLGIGACDTHCKCAMHDQWMKPKLLIQKLFRESSIKEISQKGSKI